MGGCLSHHDKIKACQVYNAKYAKRPNIKKRYENIVYDHLYDKYKFVTQKELYDFILVEHNLYIEVDEEQHLSSGKSAKKEQQTKRDYLKIQRCLHKPATLLRISWFSIANNQYMDIIKYCVENEHKIRNKLVLSSREIYEHLDMLRGMNPDDIIYYK